MVRKRKYRPGRTPKEVALAQFRGYWEPEDLTSFHHDISSVVKNAMKGFGLDDRFSEEQIFEAWSSLVDPFVSEHARPIALDRKVLYIQVLHSTIHYELERMKGQILETMQKKFGKTHIRDVKFRLG